MSKKSPLPLLAFVVNTTTTRSLLLAASLACLASAPVHAQSVEAIADTYIHFNTSGDPAPSDTNYGTATTFVTANDAGSFGLPKGNDRTAFIRFDLSLFTGPFSEGQVSLNLEKISGEAADFNVYAIVDLGTDESFNETTYTFNSSAYSATTDNSEDTNDGGLNKTSLLNLGTFSAAANATSISFTSGAMVDFLNNDTNDIATFIIYQSTQSKAARIFASSEHATLDGPMLVATAIPEPSTYAFFAGAGMLLLAVRRKIRASRVA